MAYPFTYVELHSTDAARAKSLYAAFRLEDQDTPVPGAGMYTEIDTREGPGAGLMAQQETGGRSAWLAYIKVPKLETDRWGAKYAPGANPQARQALASDPRLQPARGARPPHRAPVAGRQRRSVEPRQPLRRPPPPRHPRGPHARHRDGAGRATLGAGRAGRRRLSVQLIFPR